MEQDFFRLILVPRRSTNSHDGSLIIPWVFLLFSSRVHVN